MAFSPFFLMYMVILFFLSSVITFSIIFFSKKIKLIQFEREEGPQSHKLKQGTPTMGGISFAISASVFSFFLLPQEYWPAIFLFIAFSLIGFIDDLLKTLKSKNLGLTFWQKIIAQVVCAAAFCSYIFLNGHGLTSGSWAPLYFLFCVFIIVGASNATNLTDGLDGLLGGASIITFLAFLFVARPPYVPGGDWFCMIFIAAIFGFLVFNFPKAKIFMGDVGSLGIGAALAGYSIINYQEILLAFAGGIFVLEALSVIIQVSWYKAFKMRLLRMAPLHHHFELLGWPELYVVLFFWLIQLILAIIGVLIT